MTGADPGDIDGLTLLGREVNHPVEHVETFRAPAGCSLVRFRTDELASVCPVTGQPDLAALEIEYLPAGRCVESKSLKLYLSSFRNEGAFCEALAVRIRDDVAAALELPAERVRIALEQKARGGITITARV